MSNDLHGALVIDLDHEAAPNISDLAVRQAERVHVTGGRHGDRALVAHELAEAAPPGQQITWQRPPWLRTHEPDEPDEDSPWV